MSMNSSSVRSTCWRLPRWTGNRAVKCSDKHITHSKSRTTARPTDRLLAHIRRATSILPRRDTLHDKGPRAPFPSPNPASAATFVRRAKGGRNVGVQGWLRSGPILVGPLKTGVLVVGIQQSEPARRHRQPQRLEGFAPAPVPAPPLGR